MCNLENLQAGALGGVQHFRCMYAIIDIVQVTHHVFDVGMQGIIRGMLVHIHILQSPGLIDDHTISHVFAPIPSFLMQFLPLQRMILLRLRAIPKIWTRTQSSHSWTT